MNLILSTCLPNPTSQPPSDRHRGLSKHLAVLKATEGSRAKVPGTVQPEDDAAQPAELSGPTVQEIVVFSYARGQVQKETRQSGNRKLKEESARTVTFKLRLPPSKPNSCKTDGHNPNTLQQFRHGENTVFLKHHLCTQNAVIL